MFSNVARVAPTLFACLALRVLGQTPEPVVTPVDVAAGQEQARARLLSDPEIAPLYEKLVAANVQLHSAREALLQKSPDLVEKQAKLQDLLAQLGALGSKMELTEADRETQRRAIMAEVGPLSQVIAAARRTLEQDEETVALRKQAETLAKELDAALDKRLAADAAAQAASAAAAAAAGEAKAPAEVPANAVPQKAP